MKSGKKRLPKGITKRPNGLYMGRVTHNGKTITIYDRDIKNLQQKLDKKRYELKYGIPFEPTEMTVNEWFETWLDLYKKPSVKTGTIRVYQRHYAANIKAAIGTCKLKNVTDVQLQVLLNNMCNAGYSGKTIGLVGCILSALFKQAYKSHFIPVNPYDSVTMPYGKEQKERVVFSREQQKLYLEYTKYSYLSALFHLAIYTGMRSGELRGLLWSDVDLEHNLIHVRHTLLDDGTLDRPKTAASLRDIPLLPRACHIFQSLKANSFSGIDYNVSNHEPDFVFHCLGTPISKKRITTEIQHTLNKMRADNIDFPYFTMHTTRHTFATRCIESGMAPQTLKAILGHSSLSMTMDLYAHVLPDQKQLEMTQISDAFQ